MKNTTLFALSLLFLFFRCKTQEKPTEKTVGLVTEHAMVVTAREEASAIGVEILKKGGNAFDAMVGTELALAVAFPFAGNLGGGGFMVYRKDDGSSGMLDYREKAPLAAHKDMYLDADGEVVKGKSTLGAMAVGVPGTVAGMFSVHQKLGKIPLDSIIQPVIDLARKGIVVTPKQAERLAHYRPMFRKVNRDTILFEQNWQAGDRLKNEALARTLERIMKNGRDEFYTGETAKKLVEFMQSNGGIIKLEDLEKYQAQWRQPIRFKYDDLQIVTVAPPSSGGICLAQILAAIEDFDLGKYGHNSSEAIQIITEAERIAYADRSHYLGDPDFVEIPVETLMSKEYIKQRMSDFSFDKARRSKDLGYGKIQMVESNETTHYSIVDAMGNAVAATTTLNGGYGSKLYCEELGFFLNNEMDDFSSKPGVPNMFGLIGAEANSIAPEKRMLSSMTPTIVEKNGKLWMVVGTPGGSTIITSVLQTLLNVHEFGMGMQEAVNQPRFHHQWLPDVIQMEPNGFGDSIKNNLVSKGYTLDEKNAPVIGKVEGILILNNGKMEGGADPRGDDKAVGY